MVLMVWSTDVDFPLPGSPPRGDTWPEASPPPSARSSSSAAVGMRSTSFASISAMARDPTPATLPRRSAAAGLSVPAAPQDGQVPNHGSALAPHSARTEAVFGLAIYSISD